VSKRKRRANRPAGRGRRADVQHTSEILCVLELDGVCEAEAARNLLSYMSLPPTLLLVAYRRPALAVYRLPKSVGDCVLVTDGNRVLGMWHGCDCALSMTIRRYGGEPLPDSFDGRCARRDAGGLFRVLDVNDVLGLRC
jgi:hypothetical protein